jgi:hypothetical protein
MRYPIKIQKKKYLRLIIVIDIKNFGNYKKRYKLIRKRANGGLRVLLITKFSNIINKVIDIEVNITLLSRI